MRLKLIKADDGERFPMLLRNKACLSLCPPSIRHQCSDLPPAQLIGLLMMLLAMSGAVGTLLPVGPVVLAAAVIFAGIFLLALGGHYLVMCSEIKPDDLAAAKRKPK